PAAVAALSERLAVEHRLLGRMIRKLPSFTRSKLRRPSAALNIANASFRVCGRGLWSDIVAVRDGALMIVTPLAVVRVWMIASTLALRKSSVTRVAGFSLNCSHAGFTGVSSNRSNWARAAQGVRARAIRAAGSHRVFIVWSHFQRFG